MQRMRVRRSPYGALVVRGGMGIATAPSHERTPDAGAFERATGGVRLPWS